MQTPGTHSHHSQRHCDGPSRASCLLRLCESRELQLGATILKIWCLLEEVTREQIERTKPVSSRVLSNLDRCCCCLLLLVDRCSVECVRMCARQLALISDPGAAAANHLKSTRAGQPAHARIAHVFTTAAGRDSFCCSCWMRSSTLQMVVAPQRVRDAEARRL